MLSCEFCEYMGKHYRNEKFICKESESSLGLIDAVRRARVGIVAGFE